MPTFRAVLLTLAILAIGLAVVLPVHPGVRQSLGIAGVAAAAVDLLLRLAA